MKIAIVIPAHNEEQTILACLTSVQTAINQLLESIDAFPLVVLDSCTDNTLQLVKDEGVDYICCEYRCVGQVRDIGIRQAIKQGATWIACTDADSIVPANWLSEQVALIDSDSNNQTPADMICGVVSIKDWAHLSSQTREEYMAHYQDKMGHRHIHGANLSFSSNAYLAVGGFNQLPCHEDVDLVRRFELEGSHIVWSNMVRVTTSSRLQARTSDGFAKFLTKLEQQSHLNMIKNE